MSRPVDDNKEWSPQDIVFIGWVGDEDGNYDGLKTALKYMLESGRRGYVGFGSDIGGYNPDSRAGPLGRTKELFLRWTAVGALSSYMENGGGGEHLPWNFDNETVAIYRSWVNLHYSLVPYLYAAGTTAAINHNGTLMKPCDDFRCGASHSYLLGPSMYVVPVLRDPKPQQKQLLWLPTSPSGKWVSVFNASLSYRAHTFIDEDTSRLDRIPLYVQQGTLMPMYDLQQSSALDAFKMVLWGEANEAREIVTSPLYTRDGREWRVELNAKRKHVSVRFIQWHQPTENAQLSTYSWRFCHQASAEAVCTAEWLELRDGSSFMLENLI